MDSCRPRHHRLLESAYVYPFLPPHTPLLLRIPRFLTRMPPSVRDANTGNTNVQRGKIIAWQSETGLGNRGRVTFTSDPACVDNSVLTLCVEFNVPRAVAAVIRNDFIGQFVQSTLAADLKRFRTIALRQHSMRERARAQQRQQQQPQSQDVAVSTSDASVDSPNAAKNS